MLIKLDLFAFKLIQLKKCDLNQQRKCGIAFKSNQPGTLDKSFLDFMLKFFKLNVLQLTTNFWVTEPHYDPPRPNLQFLHDNKNAKTGFYKYFDSMRGSSLQTQLKSKECERLKCVVQMCADNESKIWIGLVSKLKTQGEKKFSRF